jgi:hypothetical protein
MKRNKKSKMKKTLLSKEPMMQEIKQDKKQLLDNKKKQELPKKLNKPKYNVKLLNKFVEKKKLNKQRFNAKRLSVNIKHKSIKQDNRT